MTPKQMGYAFKGVRYHALADLFLLWSEVDWYLSSLQHCLHDAIDLWTYVRRVAPPDDLRRHPADPQGFTSDELSTLLCSKDPTPLIEFAQGLFDAVDEERDADLALGRPMIASKLERLASSLYFLQQDLRKRKAAQEQEKQLQGVMDACAGGAG